MNFTKIALNEPFPDGKHGGWVVVCNGITSSVPNSSGNSDCARVLEDIDDGATVLPWVNPSDAWISKRLANMADGGYGTTGEQFEMIGEQGMKVYQAHIAKVKSDIPKE